MSANLNGRDIDPLHEELMRKAREMSVVAETMSRFLRYVNPGKRGAVLMLLLLLLLLMMMLLLLMMLMMLLLLTLSLLLTLMLLLLLLLFIALYFYSEEKVESIRQKNCFLKLR